MESNHYPMNGGLQGPGSQQQHPYTRPAPFSSSFSFNHKPQPSMNNSTTSSHQDDDIHTNDSDLWQYIKVKEHPNGGASIVHLDQKDFSHLSADKTAVLADMFLKETFREESEFCPAHVMGVVHNAATFLPELITHFSSNHPDVIVKMGNLKNSEIETTTFADFADRVRGSYCNGTFRCGPLLQVSLVGQVSEETGRYFPDFLGK